MHYPTRIRTTGAVAPVSCPFRYRRYGPSVCRHWCDRPPRERIKSPCWLCAAVTVGHVGCSEVLDEVSLCCNSIETPPPVKEESSVAGLGSPETSTVSVVIPRQFVSPRASPRSNPISLPFGMELGIFYTITECVLFCHPVMTPPCFYLILDDPDVCGRVTTLSFWAR